MKLSKLKQIIKEEYHNLLSEAFADPEIRKIAKMRGIKPGRWENFFKAFANTHNIAWDKLPKGTLNKSTNMNDPLVKKGLAFWVIESPKENPYHNDRSWISDRVLQPGVMSVTLQGKVQYYGGRGGVGSKGMYKSRGVVGTGRTGMLQLKKLKELADSVYVMDFESFRGGTKELKASRAELQLGKDIFKDAASWKRANLQRYKSILDARVGNRDTVDAMTAKIVKIANEAVSAGMEVTKMGKYDELQTTVNGNEVPMLTVTNAMTRALRYYAEYIRFANQHENEKEGGYGGKYYKERYQDTAGSIKKILTAFEKGDARALDRV